ncbi:MAG: hypothetical protein U1F98_01410 [Verrucomicrobiota bacterium]
MIKKLLLIAVILVVVLVVAVVLGISLFLDSAVKKGVETFGPKMTQVDVKLDNVKLSLLSGSGKIEGLVIGNPPGYTSSNAISVGSASLALKPSSLLSDKIVIRSVNVASPVITFEGGLSGNNLSKILANVKSGSGAPGETNAPAKPGQPAGPGKKLEVDEFVITGAKVNIHLQVLGTVQSMNVTLPDIHLNDLGTNADGITSGELTRLILTRIENEALKAASQGTANLQKAATDMAHDLGKSIQSTANQIVSSNAGNLTTNINNAIGNLFKKK